MVHKPLMIYDGACGFCRLWIERWKHLTQGRVDFEPYQEAALRFPEISQDRFQKSVVLVEPGGGVFYAAHAVFRSLSSVPCRGWLFKLYEKFPFWASFTEAAYRWVEGHRPFLGRATRWLWGSTLLPQDYRLTRWAFLRLLGAIYLIAFFSFLTQVEGLIGSQGISPVAEYFRAVRAQAGGQSFWILPSLFWLSAADGFLIFVSLAGVVLSVFLMIGFAVIPVLAVLWFLYLSLLCAGQEFMSFQWDVLLLEAGFLSIFFAPTQWIPRFTREEPPSCLSLWLLRFLLFKLMFLSGVVKLASADPSWRGLTALDFHYETQPLPQVLSWYAHHLPGWFQKASTLGMFAIELAVPFLFFFPRRVRFAGALITIGFQILIIATGNYCFFNLLTIALCLLLFDDGVWRWLVPARIISLLDTGRVREPAQEPPPPWRLRLKNGLRTARKFLTGAVAALSLVIGLTLIISRTFQLRGLPRPLNFLIAAVSPWRTFNSYGLFAVMTVERREIVIEGSPDGKIWKEYEFLWKPGHVKRRPKWVAPHQPRLDWQMWFAVLSPYHHNPWLMNFMVRLLQGSPEVLALLDINPFPNGPPRMIRAMVYRYNFTTPEQKRASKEWWNRELLGLYGPVISLK